MSLVDQMLGRSPLREDSSVPPALTVPAKRPSAVRRQTPEDKEEEGLKKKARHCSVVASIMGMTESDDESIIPSDADPVDVLVGGAHIPGIRSDPLPGEEDPEEPLSTTNADGEELIQPSAALVAPDVTPNVMKTIDPSQVPAPPKPPEPVAPPVPPPTMEQPHDFRGVMDTVLGRQSAQPQAASAADMEAANAMAESFLASAVDSAVDPGAIQQRVSEALTPASGGSEASIMPKHSEGDGKTVYDSFRRFTG